MAIPMDTILDTGMDMAMDIVKGAMVVMLVKAVGAGTILAMPSMLVDMGTGMVMDMGTGMDMDMGKVTGMVMDMGTDMGTDMDTGTDMAMDMDTATFKSILAMVTMGLMDITAMATDMVMVDMVTINSLVSLQLPSCMFLYIGLSIFTMTKVSNPSIPTINISI